MQSAGRVALLASCVCAAAACRGPAPPCVPGRCGAGRACLDGACRPAASARVPPGARRWIVRPEAIAVVGGGAEPGTLPPSCTLGGPRGASTVLLRFGAPWGSGARVAAAWLTVDPAPGAPPPRAPVALRVAEVLDPWEPARASTRSAPRTAAAAASAWLATPVAGPVRIDVTRLVQRADRAGSERPARGLALVAGGDDPVGAVLATGAGAGDAPRLEVWTR